MKLRAGIVLMLVKPLGYLKISQSTALIRRGLSCKRINVRDSRDFLLQAVNRGGTLASS